jgi:acyl CoA:acetate/3-ketoacid CoA transferase beta subunit
VIADKAISGFDPETRTMRSVSIHPGNSVEDVVGSMGLTPFVPEKVSLSEPARPVS